MSQLTYPTVRAKGVPGLMYGNPLDNYIVGDYVSNEILEPGRLVVLDASTGKLKVPANASAAALTEQIVGVVVYQITMPQATFPGGGFTYPAGVKVPIMRRGRIWAQVSSTVEPTPLADANVKHSSTVATHRGKFTTDASAATAGSEVAAVLNGNMKFIEKDTTALWLVEVNIP